MLVVLSGAVSFLAVGTGADGAGAPGRTVMVAFDEWTAELERDRVRSGRVTFEATNRGSVEHELLVLRTNLPPGELPQEFGGPVAHLAGPLVVGKAHRHGAADSYAVGAGLAGFDHVKPGETKRYRAKLDPGRYVVYCGLVGHYARGQFTGLEVSRR